MTTLLLAAHGSSQGSDVAVIVQRHADTLAGAGRFDPVLTAYYKQPPYFRDALREVRTAEVYVVPFCTSRGWFSTRVLPGEMGLTGPVTCRDGQTIRLTEPVGEHPGVTQLIHRLGRQTANEHGLDAEATSLVLVGHGTLQHDHSGAAAHRHVEALRLDCGFAEVVAVFLDQAPLIEQVGELTSRPAMVVVPYLIGGSVHVTRDLPRRLGMTEDGGVSRSAPAVVQGRRVVTAPSPFEEAAMAALVTDCAARCTPAP